MEYKKKQRKEDIDNRGISVAKSKLVRFLVVGIVVLVLSLSGEVFAQETSEPTWELVETVINHENKPKEFIVGVTPNYYSPRFDGSFNKYTIEETYFIHKCYWKDHVGTPSESLEVDVEMRADFTKPPEILVPGEKITLNAKVSATGTSPGRGSAIQFEYRADGINLRDTTQVSTGSNSEPPFSTYSISPYFVVPETHSGEISIVAFLWNAGAVNVRWIYREQDSTPTDITPPPTDLTTSGTSTTSICGQENLFKNPDFENVDHSSSAGLVASKWSAYWYPEMNSVTDAHSGSYSLKVSNNPGKTSPYNNYDGVKQDFYPTLSKDHYTMSCWLRSASGALALEMGMSDSNFGVPHSSKKFTITETWKRYEYSDHASPGRTYIRLTGASGTFYIDDCDLCLTASVQQSTPSSSSTETPTPTDITPPLTDSTASACTGTSNYAYIESITMQKGKEARIAVMMCNAKDLANMDFSISYDPRVLDFKDAEKGSLNSKSLFESNEISSGNIKISFASSKGVSGSGSIAILIFDVVGSSGDSTILTGTVNTASTSSGSPTSITIKPGKFTVGESSVPGDCDRDGLVTSKDALAALQMSVDKINEDLCYDVTGDGKVNSADAREILKKAVKNDYKE